jgi:endogenous inhibitor of DNA gyrase (YacG/DUF329 family)
MSIDVVKIKKLRSNEMKKTIRCSNRGCGFTTTTAGFMKPILGVECPGCGHESLYVNSKNSTLDCWHCSTKWDAVGCPECGKGISEINASGLSGGCLVAIIVVGILLLLGLFGSRIGV